MNAKRGDGLSSELYKMCHPQQSQAYRGSTNPYENRYKARGEELDERERKE